VIPPLSHWRAAGAAAVFVLAGSSAVALAMHDKPTWTPAPYRPAPQRAPSHRPLAARQTAAGRAGLRLMGQAAAACRGTAFSGVQVSRWWGPAGTLVSMTDIWHEPGGQTVASPVSAGALPESTSATDPGPSVSMVISPQQMTLMQTSYVLEYAGPGSADGRPADVVAVDRPDGTLAAKYWLDGRTKLPLRRQLFDDHARVISDISLADLRIGPGSLGGMPAAAAQPWPRDLGGAAVGALRAQGWPLPAELPGGMVQFAATETSASDSAGRTIGMSYSDGLSVISLFVQRGELPGAMAGWRHIAIGGHDAYAVDPDDQTIAWSGDGYVFTVLADAPSAMVDQAIAALPHGSPPGFFTRLGRGFRRMASWANPFR
jgi:sigma-E factor negative regulatory protein RseB